MIQWGDPGLSTLIAAAYLSLLTLLWTLLAWGVTRWAHAWRLSPDDAETGPFPLLSICIPARDEAGRIGRCVRAALASDYSPLEVIVVDDCSEDGTAEEALVAAGDDARLRVIRGSDPPTGWAGKPWACHRAAGEAAGAMLLFVDADVRLSPWAARAAVSRMRREGHALISLFGDWELLSFWEKVCVPVVGWFIRGAVDMEGVNDRVQPTAFANGQFLLVEREAYQGMGGHKVVSSEVLEDVHLARAFKQRAHHCGLFFAPGAFVLRPYENLREILAGYSKNLYEGMDRRLMVGLGAVSFVFIGTLAPYLLLALLAVTRGVWGWQIASPFWWAWLGSICLLVHVFRWRLERMQGRSGAYCWSHPLGNLVLVWVILRSVFAVEATWKGRDFVDGRAVAPK